MIIDDDDMDITSGPDDFDDDYNEPVGSCEECGINLYEEDDPEYCDQCLWRLQVGM